MQTMGKGRRGAAALAFFALLATPVIAPGPGGMLRVPGPVGGELVPVAEAADTQGPAISADAGIVVDAKTGEVLFAKNADKREYPASMTKMMTCVLALEEAGADELVVASANAADVECTRIHAGDTVRIYYVRPAGRVEFCENTNELLTTYPGCIGGKTGWTNAARGCLAVAAKRNGRTLVAVVMHSQDDEGRFTEAARLLDYGFAQ